MSLYLFPLCAPLLMLAAAALGFARKGHRPRLAIFCAEGAAVGALLIAMASLAILIQRGAGGSGLIGWDGVGLSARLDAVSATMLLLVAFVGWIVVRYSRTYLDGEVRQGYFIGWLCVALAAVLLLVQSGNVAQLAAAWIATSVALHRLILFYPERVAAQRAARKKRLFSTLGAIALAISVALMWSHFGTTDIAVINTAARASDAHWPITASAAFLAVAAVLKSAQFPTHGWLTEMMEAPTPVSALLHAGVINGGGFLMIRFADVMLSAPGVLAVLAMLGGFTALFAALVMLTQPAVKTSLAWSTAAQMGFMILQCGLALFPLALLHIVAHSVYKAHAFLAAGGAVEQVAAIRRPGPVATPDVSAVWRSFLIAITIYVGIGTVFGLAFGFEHKSPQALALGTILIFGVAYLLAQGLAEGAPRPLMLRTAIYASAAAIGYFALQTAAEWLTAGVLPSAPAPGRLEWTLMALAVLSFGVVAVAQALFPLWAVHPAAAGLRVHLANGLYVNALLDRILGGWSVRKAPAVNQVKG